MFNRRGWSQFGRRQQKAYFQSLAGHAALMSGDPSGAARRWHDAMLTKFNGYAKLQAEYEQARRDAESRQEMLSMVGFIAGLAVDVKAARDGGKGEATWATALRDAVGPGNLVAMKFGEVAQAFASLPTPPRVDAGMLSAGLPVGTVLRAPATTDAGPFMATVRVRTPGSYCTGTRVHQRVVLTNAHCIVDEKTGKLRDGPWSVVHEGIRGDTSATVVDWTTVQGRRGSWHGRAVSGRSGLEDGSDWALLVIDGASDLAKWQAWRRVARTTPEAVVNGSQPLMLGGYSGDLAKGFYLTMHYSCRVQRPIENMLLSDCETAGGSSGSALYSLDNPYVVVGLHNSGKWRFANGDTFSSGEVRVENFIDALDDVIRSVK